MYCDGCNLKTKGDDFQKCEVCGGMYCDYCITVPSLICNECKEEIEDDDLGLYNFEGELE